MKENKKIVKVTRKIAIVSFFIYLICVIPSWGICNSDNNRIPNIIGNVSLGIFGSAIMGCIMSYYSYCIKKNELIHDIIHYVIQYKLEICGVEPFSTDIPTDILYFYTMKRFSYLDCKEITELENKQILRKGTTKVLLGETLLREWVKQTNYPGMTDTKIDYKMMELLENAKKHIDARAQKYAEIKLPDRAMLDTYKYRIDFLWEKENKKAIDELLDTVWNYVFWFESEKSKLTLSGSHREVYKAKLGAIKRIDNRLFDIKGQKGEPYESEEMPFCRYIDHEVSNKFIDQIDQLMIQITGSQFVKLPPEERHYYETVPKP